MCIDTYNNDDVQPYPNLVPSLLCNTYFNSSPDPSAHDNDSFHSYSVLTLILVLLFIKRDLELDALARLSLDLSRELVYMGNTWLYVVKQRAHSKCDFHDIQITVTCTNLHAFIIKPSSTLSFLKFYLMMCSNCVGHQPRRQCCLYGIGSSTI